MSWSPLNVVSSCSNLLDSTAATRSLIDITFAFDALEFVRDDVVRRREATDMDGCSKLIVHGPRNGRVQFILYVSTVFSCLQYPTFLLFVSFFDVR